MWGNDAKAPKRAKFRSQAPPPDRFNSGGTLIQRMAINTSILPGHSLVIHIDGPRTFGLYNGPFPIGTCVDCLWPPLTLRLQLISHPVSTASVRLCICSKASLGKCHRTTDV